jgi:2-dehydro-3-deoxygalactonokinase
MCNYLTIDGGTTNTRISLVRDREVIDKISLGIGVKDCIGNKDGYVGAIKDGIAKILDANGFAEADITSIIASGMITSDMGLVTLAHTTTPAGARELHDTVHTVMLEDICKIPFSFIRGVKTGSASLENADMMRGEETEIMGLFKGEGVYVLPGSHSKAVSVDSEGRIVFFKTYLTGEMLYALSTATILKDSVSLGKNGFDVDYLKKGFEYAGKHGVNEALFKTRVLKNLFGSDDAETYSFFLGAVLSDEVRSISEMGASRYVICGKSQLREPTAYLLESLTDGEIISVSDAEAGNATAIGAVRIFEYGK